MIATPVGTLLVALYAQAVVAPPQAPTFQLAPAFLTTREEIHVELRIVPHPDIRYVVLEAWEAPRVDDACSGELGAFTNRSSLEPVGEGNRDQQMFPFAWRQSLAAGCYVLVGKVTLPAGLTKERRHRLEVLP